MLLVRASVPSPRNDASADAPDSGTSEAALAPALAASGSADAPGPGASTEALAPGTSADALGSGTSAPPGSSAAKAVDVGWGQDALGAETSPPDKNKNKSVDEEQVPLSAAAGAPETGILGPGASSQSDVLESGASVPPSAARRELEGLLR